MQDSQMVKLKKKLKYFLNSSCNHEYILAKHFKKKPLGEVKFPIKEKYNRKYYQCLICDHHISDHGYDLSNLYSGDYVNSTYGGLNDLIKKYNKISNLREDKSDNFFRCLRIKNFFKKYNRKFTMLDVGAGLGIFPKKLKNNKFKDIFLIEKDNISIDFLRKHLKFKNTFKTLPKSKNNYFDLITLNKVIEHVSNPAKFLKDHLFYLKNKGYLYLEVPDVDARYDKDGYNREEFFIEHHHGFSMTSLILMLNKLNLKIVKIEKIREPSSKYTIYCFAQKIK